LWNSTSRWRRNSKWPPDTKIRIWKHHFIQKYCWNNFCSKIQNGGVIQDGAINHCLILSGLAQPFINRFYHINPFWTCKIKHFHIPPIIQNGVNILDGDFTFIYPFVWSMYKRHFQAYNLQTLDSNRKLYENQWHVWVFWFIV
jgi:hypothetical protein